MQTFLPYKNFVKSAECLDYRRLGKQRVEAFQILNALDGKSKGWVNHPATRMWRGYEDALKLYHNVCIEEWVKRGYKNTMQLKDVPEDLEMPWWLGDEKLHASHRSKLLEKDFDYYSVFNWLEKPGMAYWWPIDDVALT